MKQVSELPSFLRLSNTPSSGHSRHVMSAHSPTSGHLVCFHAWRPSGSLLRARRAALSGPAFSSGNSGTAGSHGSSIFNFSRNRHTVFHFPFLPTVCQRSDFSTSPQHLCFLFFKRALVRGVSPSATEQLRWPQPRGPASPGHRASSRGPALPALELIRGLAQRHHRPGPGAHAPNTLSRGWQRCLGHEGSLPSDFHPQSICPRARPQGALSPPPPHSPLLRDPQSCPGPQTYQWSAFISQGDFISEKMELTLEHVKPGQPESRRTRTLCLQNHLCSLGPGLLDA